MKFIKLMVIAAAATAMVSCCGESESKFNAKEYAERKTERMDKIVELDEQQEKAVYAIYLEEGKQIQKDLKAIKKEGLDKKQPDQRTAKCDKNAECPKVKGECPKAANCDKKAECPKVKGECPKAKGECPKVKGECPKVKGECPKVKGECPKAKGECPKVKGECPKAANCDKKAECPKAANCDKKAECPKVKGECPKVKGECPKAKGECPKAKDECPKAKGECPKVKGKCATNEYLHQRHPRHAVKPEMRKARIEKMKTILTPQQQEKLKMHKAASAMRREQSKQTPACCPAPAEKNSDK